MLAHYGFLTIMRYTNPRTNSPVKTDSVHLSLSISISLWTDRQSSTISFWTLLQVDRADLLNSQLNSTENYGRRCLTPLSLPLSTFERRLGRSPIYRYHRSFPSGTNLIQLYLSLDQKYEHNLQASVPIGDRQTDVRIWGCKTLTLTLNQP